MRIFSIAKHLCPFELQRQHGRKLDLAALRLLFEISGNQTVVARSMLKHLHRQLTAQLARYCSCLCRIEHALIVGRIHDHQDIVVVFGCRAQHRRTADIDIFNGLFEGTVRLCDRRFERIEIDHDHVDGPDPLLLHLLDMGRNRTASKQAAMNLGVQCFDAAVENFR